MVGMAFISDTERQRIAEAIREVEARTSGELVTVIARESDSYYYIPTLWAALSALILPALVSLLGFEQTLLGSYGAQVVMFVIVALLLRIPSLKYAVVPAAVKRHRATRLAHEQFLLHNMHHTEHRSAVLIFVSVAEHYVEVIADKGINDLVDPGTWEQVVAGFVARVKQGQVADGFVEAVHACGAHLERHFPVQDGDRNELPDHLIEI
jgi:putative membrane protein